jgi:hypothetical protein
MIVFMETPLMSVKALAARPQVGSALLSNPLRQIVGQPAGSEILKAPCSFAASAFLSTEEDYEMSSEFLDVFARASERVAGFVVGCSVIAAVWLAWSLF